MTTKYNLIPELNGIEITFSDKPGDVIRGLLKDAGFRWHRARGIWYAKQNAERLELAERLAKRNENMAAEFKAAKERAAEKYERARALTPEEFADRYQIIQDSEGWHGNNSKGWKSDDELKAAILRELRANGIKATARKNRAGYLCAFTFTITLPAEDAETPEEYARRMVDDEDARGTYSRYWYTDAAGREWHMSEFNGKKTAEIEAIRLEHYARFYGASNLGPHQVKPEIRRKVEAIVNSFNHDHSDGMIDYFDRGIYDSYKYKIA